MNYPKQKPWVFPLKPIAPLPEWADLICPRCNGSGEGQYEGTKCYACNGSGIEPSEDDCDEYEDPIGENE